MPFDKQPLVSVIIPLFNYEKYISDCIMSVQKQDYDNYEIIVCDDCSTDGSFAIAKSFEDDHIKIMKLEKNSGYSVAKNEAIIASRGELITCIDADDLFTKKSISSRVKAMGKFDVPFIHARAISVKGDISLKDCYKIDPKTASRETPRVHAQTVMLKRFVHVKFGLYDETLRSRADKEMWWRLFGKDDTCEFKIKKKQIKKDVAYYRKHTQSMMVKRRKDPKLQRRLTDQLNKAYEMRKSEGITRKNTRFLEA